MTEQTAGHSRPALKAQDFRLLLTRLEQAPFDETGRQFVEKVLSRNDLLPHFDDGQVLRLAILSQQHGFIQQSLEIYAWLNLHRPECRDGWRSHCQTLGLLGDRQGLVRLRALAAPHVPAAELESWFNPGAAPFEHEEVPADGFASIAAPFAELQKEESDIRLFMHLFRGRDDAFARQWVNREEDRCGYVPVRRPLMAGDIRDHLAGRKTYGIYLLDGNSMVHTGVIDVDLVARLRNREEARKQKANIRREGIYLIQRIHEFAGEAGLTCIPEFSGGKGYHFWFPVADPVPAGDMRRALLHLANRLRGDVQCFALEVFPKQERLTGKGFGNLVKLPLGIHRGTGKPSCFALAADRTAPSQFDLLRTVQPAPPEAVKKLAGLHGGAEVVAHPRHAQWAAEFPELATLEARCAMLAQIIAGLRASRTLSTREEKILLGTLGHLPRAGLLLHHLFARLPEYNRPLLDYRLSRVRGTVLGCKRIHSLLEQGGAGLPCEFKDNGYPHPLRHLEGFSDDPVPKSEKVENLRDALISLKTAIEQIERFI
ncbi:MAG: CRISPR-associated primase-polymerase type A1 [Desulfobulbaceae bacterium]|nr:CRISPR-associated primase-polymerase type A1 [Desulfobulbaceae bacterium]MDY0352361.1 CRISPR-associated primase-polymerase type A1 [Desulfobulbaceae bacterium]